MKIGLIGTGNIAVALGKIWAANGHKLFFSYSRSADKLAATGKSVDDSALSGTPAEAVQFGEVVVLAVPFTALEEALKQAGSLRGKLVFSTVNALKADYSGLAIGTTTSAAEEIARLAPGARVVEGLPAFAEVLSSANRKIAGEQATVFVSGDDPAALGRFAAARQTRPAKTGQ